MSWSLIPLDLKKEILSFLVDRRSIGTLYLSCIGSKLYLVCKEFKEILTKLNCIIEKPFINKYIPDEYLIVASAWKEYLIIHIDVYKYMPYEEGKEGPNYEICFGVNRDYLFAISMEAPQILNVYSSFPLENPFASIPNISSLCSGESKLRITNVKDTTIGIMIIITARHNMHYCFIFDSSKKELKLFAKIYYSGIILGFNGIFYMYTDTSYMFISWEKLKSGEPAEEVDGDIMRGYLTFYKTDNKYIRCEKLPTEIRAYDEINHSQLWYIESRYILSLVNNLSPGIEDLIAINGNFGNGTHAIIIDILTLKEIYKSPPNYYIEAITSVSKNKFFVWLREIK